MKNANPSATARQPELFPTGQPLAKFPIALSYLLEDRSLEDVAAGTGLRDVVIRQHLMGVLAPSQIERAAYARFFGWSPAEFERQIRLWGTGCRVRLDIDRQTAERLDELAMRAGVTLEQFIARMAGND